MRIRGRGIIPLLAGLLLIIPVAKGQEKGEFKKDRYGFSEVIERSFKVDKGGTAFLYGSQGYIRADVWDKNEVKVVVEKLSEARTEDEAKAVFADFEVYIEKDGKDVRIKTKSRWTRGRRHIEVRYSLMVPENYNIDVETEGGSIEIGDLVGNVTAKTAGGSISVGYIKDGNVDINTSGGSLTIKGIENGEGKAYTSGGSITVGDVTGTVDAKTSGGTIRLGKIGKTANANTAGGSISVEESIGDLYAKTSGGSIRIELSSGEVEVRTSGGSIRIGPSKGEVRAHTAGGSIRVEDAGKYLEAKTAGGGISVDGSKGPVVVETSGGSISVKEARGYIEASTAGGSVEAELLVSDKDVDTHVTLTSAGGDVVVYLPEDLAATFDVELEVKQRSWKDYKIYSDFPINIEEKNGGWGRYKVFLGTGDINGGGDVIRLQTVNGDIKIRKLRR